MVVHLYIQQWKLAMIRSILIYYSDIGNKIVAVIGFGFYIAAIVSWEIPRHGMSHMGVPLFYIYVLACDILFFVAVVLGITYPSISS